MATIVEQLQTVVVKRNAAQTPETWAIIAEVQAYERMVENQEQRCAEHELLLNIGGVVWGIKK